MDLAGNIQIMRSDNDRGKIRFLFDKGRSHRHG